MLDFESGFMSMSILSENSITIYEAMQNIETGKYVMPAFQRQYVWSMEQIEKLWDSILQGYPISTFLYWHIDDSNVTGDTYFCDFMHDVRFDSTKRADDVNYELRAVNLSISDTAVLDGQQRLTSLFISLFGTSNIRPKNQRRANTTSIVTKLLIELNENKIDTQDEYNEKKFDIKFTDKVGKAGVSQFDIKNILKDEFKNPNTRANAIDRVVANIPTDSKDYATKVLNLLCTKVYEEKLIRYTEIHDMNQDDALEMFVRFNSGGRPLSKSDITMSILEAYWASAKTQFGNLLTGDFAGFGTEFVVRTAHMIYGDVVKSNISKQVAMDLKNNWIDFRKAFKNTAQILKDANIDISRFKNSWNVLVPIIFCVYNNPVDYVNFTDGILKYLYRAILFTYFSSGTTGKLQIMRKHIMEYEYEISTDMLDQINELRVTDAKLEDLMNYEKGNRVTGEILYYISLDWIRDNVRYEQDHLHPYDRFYKTQPGGISVTEWAEWRKLANRVPNLHLLFGRGNASKSDMPLQEYYDDMTEAEQEAFKQNSYIPDESLNIINFANFYEKRKELLIEKIKSLII